MNKTADDIQLADLKLDSHGAIDRLYRRHREEFVQFGRRYLEQDDDILDAYQDAIIVLFERVSSGRLDSLTSSVKTYLFAIGKYIMIDTFKKSQRVVGELLPDASDVGHTVDQQIELSEQQQMIYKAMMQLDINCQDILTLFYYRRYNLEAIATDKGYRNANVVKSLKGRCMQRLRQIFMKLYHG